MKGAGFPRASGFAASPAPTGRRARPPRSIPPSRPIARGSPRVSALPSHEIRHPPTRPSPPLAFGRALRRVHFFGFTGDPAAQTTTQGDRKSVVKGKSVSVRVSLGGRRIIKKKKKEH